MYVFFADDIYDYECSICTTPFRRKDNLERHMKSAHPESIIALGDRRQIVSVVKISELPVGVGDTSLKKDVSSPNHVISDDKTPKNVPLNENSDLKSHKLDQELISRKKPRKLLKGVGKKERTSAKIPCSSEGNVNQIKSFFEQNIFKNIRLGFDEDINYKTIEKNNKSFNDESSVIMNSSVIDKNKRKEQNISNVENDKEELNSSMNVSFDSSACKTNEQPFIMEQTKPNNKESIPRCQKVSVISSCKKYFNNVKQLSKSSSSSIGSSKKTEPVLPYRLITPPVKSPNTEGSNSVIKPTITKVTHIVHTSDNGVSNIRTVITTRDVVEKPKTNKSKPKNSENQIDEPKDGKGNSSVIKYVPKTTRSSTETKHKCYRIIGQNSNTIMSRSNKNSYNIVNNSLPFQELFNSVTDDSTVLSETSLSMRSIPCTVNGVNDYDKGGAHFNDFSDNTTVFRNILPSMESNLINENKNGYDYFDNNSYNQMQDTLGQLQSNFYCGDKMGFIPGNSTVYNSNKIIRTNGNVSESCLLADNSLDESLTASLYLENELSNNRSDSTNNCLSAHADIGNVIKAAPSRQYSNVRDQIFLNEISCLSSSGKNMQNISSNLDSQVNEFENDDNMDIFNGAPSNNVFHQSNGYQNIRK